MMSRKKLQVFVSSTYTDLIEERQAAVEAILLSGHIPAGMELFAAGDESQMNVINRWIDESDVYLLILGGRYGSIESVSQKSYTHLEYEYASNSGKALFAVVITQERLDDKVRASGATVIETENAQKLREFKQLVKTKMVRTWGDARDIKLAILETLPEFAKRDNLIGWIPGSEAVDNAPLVEDIGRLTKENAQLRLQLQSASADPGNFNGLTFEQMYGLLSQTEIVTPLAIHFKTYPVMQHLGTLDFNLLHAFWILSRVLQLGVGTGGDKEMSETCSRLEELGLIEENPNVGSVSTVYYTMTSTGKQFWLRLRVDQRFSGLEEHIVSAEDFALYAQANKA